MREFGADGIVVATGGTRPERGFRVTAGAGGSAGSEGSAHDGVLDVRDWLAARRGLVAGDWPKAVTIWGADSVAMSVADTLATHGTRVLLVGPEQTIAPESGRRAKILAVPRLEANPDVRTVVDSRIVEAEAPGTRAGRVRVVGPEGEQWLDAPGPVLVSRGVVPLSAAVDREGREAALGLAAGVPVVLAGTVVDHLPPTASNAIKIVNEANGYYDYVSALVAATPEGEAVESWQIADSRFVRKYPLGMAKPLPVPLFPYVRSGYLRRGRTPEELAAACGIDSAGLRATVERFDENARRGVDPEFERGETEFNRYGGDPKVGPNPLLGWLVDTTELMSDD